MLCYVASLAWPYPLLEVSGNNEQVVEMGINCKKGFNYLIMSWLICTASPFSLNCFTTLSIITLRGITSSDVLVNYN